MKKEKGNIIIQNAPRPYENKDLIWLKKHLIRTYKKSNLSEREIIKRLFNAIEILHY